MPSGTATRRDPSGRQPTAWVSPCHQVVSLGCSTRADGDLSGSGRDPARISGAEHHVERHYYHVPRSATDPTRWVVHFRQWDPMPF